MDLFSVLGIEEPEAQMAQAVNKTTSKASGTVSKVKGKKPVGKALSKVARPVNKYQSQVDIRKMPIGIDWTVHYATHQFSVEDLARVFVEMDDTVDLDALKVALWAKIPVDVQELIEKARRQGENLAAPSETLLLEEVLGENDEEHEDVDDLEVDEESDEVREKKNSSASVKAPEKEELIDGDLTVDMVRQSLALRWYEFATEDSVVWRVDKEAKRLIPSIIAAKMG